MRNVAYIIKNMFQTIYYCTKTCNGDAFYCVINLLLCIIYAEMHVPVLSSAFVLT